MAPLLLYATCAVGAIGLYLILRPGQRPLRMVGVLIGLGALAFLAVEVTKAAGGWGAFGERGESPIFFGLFGLIAVAGAVRMITHQRPVYAALYFVLVIISSAGLFLLMQAEFMAFALVIVYAGAILITYLFVLMLAQQARSEHDLRSLAEYDRTPREPVTAVLVGLILVAVLGDALFGTTRDGLPRYGQPRPLGDALLARAEAWSALDRMPRALDRAAREVAPQMQRVLLDDRGRALRFPEGRPVVRIVDADGLEREIELPESLRPGNTQRVGLALVADFPVSLELAGVILTMAMFGAVVLARKQYELGEDQRREAAGMRRFSLESAESGIEREEGP